MSHHHKMNNSAYDSFITIENGEVLLSANEKANYDTKK